MHNRIAKLLRLLCTPLSLLLLIGCGVGQYSATTTASYTGPDGKTISYESNKEQQGLEVDYEIDADGKVKAVHIKVDKASTNEQAIAAAAASMAQAQANLARLVEQAMTVLKGAALAPK